MSQGKQNILVASVAAIVILAPFNIAHAGLFGKGGLIGGTIGQALHEVVEKPLQNVQVTKQPEEQPRSKGSEMGPCTPTAGRACDQN